MPTFGTKKGQEVFIVECLDKVLDLEYVYLFVYWKRRSSAGWFFCHFKQASAKMNFSFNP